MTAKSLEYLAVYFTCLTFSAPAIGQDTAPQMHDPTTRSQSLTLPDPAPPQLPAPSTDYNSSIFYRNKLEFSATSGYLPINIPFAFDVFVGGDYSQNPLHYTLVPTFLSLRWQMGAVRGPWFLRGNSDLTVTGSATFIPRGPENHYGAFDLGFRRNFVPRRWRATPYFEVRLGAGLIDAQEPNGNAYAQGQNFTFTLMPGAGVRYNPNGRWSAEAGISYMHISNLYLSEPKYDDNGINVVGPMAGFNLRLGKAKK